MQRQVITKDRFNQAQLYEGNYWKSRRHDPVGLIHDLESPFALSQHLQRDGWLAHTFDKFLDLGCGGLGIGILWLIQANEKYGLDPLPIYPPDTSNPFLDQFIQNIQSWICYFEGGTSSLQNNTLIASCATTYWTMSITPIRYFQKPGEH